MSKRLQSGILLAVLCSALATVVAFAQSAHPDRPPQRQQSPPPKSNPAGNHPPAPNQNSNRPPSQSSRQNQNREANRPPSRQSQPPADRNPQRNDHRPPSTSTGANRPDNFAPGNPNHRPTTSYDRPNGYSARP